MLYLKKKKLYQIFLKDLKNSYRLSNVISIYENKKALFRANMIVSKSTVTDQITSSVPHRLLPHSIPDEVLIISVEFLSHVYETSSELQ